MTPLPCHTLPPVWSGVALVPSFRTAGLRQALLATPETQPHILGIVSLWPCVFKPLSLLQFLSLRIRTKVQGIPALKVDADLIKISYQRKNKHRNIQSVIEGYPEVLYALT